MTSARKREANRRNARASTGPKTAAGKTRAAQNAHRHGLTVPLSADPTSSEDVAVLARMIAGRNASPEVQEIARRAAEAQIAVIRVRQATVSLFNHYLDDPGYRPAKDLHRDSDLPRSFSSSPTQAPRPLAAPSSFIRPTSKGQKNS